MASGTSCSRVDQFYHSKKKHKFVSPILKSGTIEQNANSSLEGSSYKQDQVRRNLISEIESSSRYKHMETISTIQGHQRDNMKHIIGGLSNKRKGNDRPSVLDLEDKSNKKMHLSIIKETSVGNELSLRKCIRTSMEAVDVTSCNTPRRQIVKLATEESPQSMQGSSIVSPGDAFWKEALQVFDEMSNHNKHLYEHVEEPKGSGQFEINHIDDVSNQSNDNRSCNTPSVDIKSCDVDILKSVESTSSSCVLSNDPLDIENWLPSELCNMYKRKGVSKLYPWQADCLQVDGVLQKKNLVYCASTSAGKSFVAEILMLRRLLSTRKMAILVLPYVSICTEKASHLETLLEPIGIRVHSFYGTQSSSKLPKDTSVSVCTIEKANSLLNRLLEEGRLSEVGIIVIDELHMVGDQHRGYLLELMLTKLRYGNTDPTHDLQIVGMSATLPNVSAVADWLQAALYQTDFRPVPLEEYIKVGDSIYNKKMELVRTIPKRAHLGGKDPDHIVELCNEVVQEGHSVLIFCSSRKGCESTAKHVAKYLTQFSLNNNTINGEKENEYPDIPSAIDALKKSPAGLDPVLAETLPSGVAYHHAGLTVEEREVVENCYRKGLIRVLTATSTLAAGVNLLLSVVIGADMQT